MTMLYRWGQLVLAVLLLAGCASAPSPQLVETFEASAPLGHEQVLLELYSWPNTPDSPQSLTDTISHYTRQSGVRDGLADLDVTVWNDLGRYTVNVRSTEWQVLGYTRRLPAFLSIGQLAVAATARLKSDGLWNDKEWRLFLPLGLALVEQRSVQLLHFPPDYALPTQDYLGAKTSQRWEELLQQNGVAGVDVTLHEAIVDIAPIAAPASSGGSLKATYSYYAPYARRMLEFLLQRKDGTARPLVAYGAPVRQWVQQQYGVTLKVLDTASIDLGDGVAAPVIGANHPSFIWYAKDQGFETAEQVMHQDLTAACWQVTMADNPTADAVTTRQTCDEGWRARATEVCELTWQQAFDKTADEAQQLCAERMAGTPVDIGGLAELEQSVWE